MGWLRRDKERERYYLLPGMGGKNLRRKQNYILKWTFFAGLLTAGILAALLYFFNRV